MRDLFFSHLQDLRKIFSILNHFVTLFKKYIKRRYLVVDACLLLESFVPVLSFQQWK